MGVIGGIAIGVLFDSASYTAIDGATRLTQEHYGARTDSDLGLDVSSALDVHVHGAAGLSAGSHLTTLALAARYRAVDHFSVGVGLGIEQFWVDSVGISNEEGGSSSAYTAEVAAHYVLVCGCQERGVEFSVRLEWPLSISLPSGPHSGGPSADTFWTGGVSVGYHWGQ